MINPAAYAQVDLAENQPAIAFDIDAKAPAVMAEICKAQNATLVHYSTDYVFSGQSFAPYKEDAAEPVNIYGLSKLEGKIAKQSVVAGI